MKNTPKKHAHEWTAGEVKAACLQAVSCEGCCFCIDPDRQKCAFGHTTPSAWALEALTEPMATPSMPQSDLERTNAALLTALEATTRAMDMVTRPMVSLGNNPDVFYDQVINGALINGCDFVYISPGDDGFPRLQVIDGRNATGEMDPITRLLKEGYAVLARDDLGSPTLEAYFEPYKITYTQGGKSGRSAPGKWAAHRPPATHPVRGAAIHPQPRGGGS